MRKLSKILSLVLVLMMVFAVVSAFSFTSSAAKIPGGTKLYLVPSANWNQSNARFAAYFFGDGEAWVSMTKVAGQSNLYEVTVPAGKNFTNVIFCRMNPSASANNWNNKWNQTSDLVYNGTSNCYTVKEGTWDKGGGTWSTYGSTCTHANVGPAATCTTAQECLDCGDPVVSALGHTYNTAHLCTRCNEQATFTVAGSGAYLGTEWDTGNTANDMTFADGVYTKVYTNVAAGTYKFKVARDHDWGTSYPSADKSYTVSTAGSTVTITLKGTTVNVTVEVPHVCEFSDATCTEPAKCSCGETQGEALGHDHVYGVCSRCGNIADGWVEVKTLEELNAALLNGGNIVLGANVESADLLNIVANTVINGNGNTLTYTGANRVIDVKKDYVDVNLTIVNLTINTTASFVERGINYNTNGVLTLDNVTVEGTNINYAINLPSSSNDATVNIANSNITGNIALNIWGQNIVVTATNTNFVSPYVSDVEVCPVIKLNNNGTVAAHGTRVTVNGGSIVSADTNYGVAVSVSASDTSITISDETTVEGLMATPSILIKYEGQNEFYSSTSLQSAINTASNNPKATVVLIGDIVLDSPIVVEGTVVLDLNGFELSYESTVQGEAMITNKGSLIINDSVGTGVINYNYVGAADNSYGKGNYTISNAGTLTVNGGKITIANLSGHAKYPIDNNSTTGDAILVINGGHLYNYNTSAIRMFCNSTTNKNSVTINGGLIEGYSAIWMQNPGKNTVNGELTIAGGEIRTTAKAWVNGTSELKDVSSAIYCTIAGEGGAWNEASFVTISGGTINENVYLAESAPASLIIGEATFNGYVEMPHVHSFVDGKCECGEEDPNYVPPHVHNHVAAVTAPTCTEAGYTTYTCECGDTYTDDEVAALGHTDVDPEDHECDACGLAISDCVDANNNHKCDICDDVMSECTDGDKNHFCDICGVQNSHCIDIPPYDHNCDWCGAKMSEHDYVDGVCSICGADDPNYVPPHVHNHVAAVTAPTCTEAGYTTYTCECGDTYTGDEVASLGHDMIVDEAVAPTCTATGLTEGSHCSRCDYAVAQEEVDKLGHIDANLDIECDREGCTSKVAPPADSVLSSFTANCLGSKVSVSSQYYFIGTIVEVLDQRNGVFLADDGTGETFYFRLPKNAEGVAHSSWDVKLTLGDKVQLYGKINKFTATSAPNGQYWPAMQSPVVTLLEQHTHVANAPATCYSSAVCVCGYVVTPALGHVDEDGNKVCDRCPWNMSAVAETIMLPLTAIGDTENLTKSTALWMGTEASVLVSKGSGSSFCAVKTYDHMRLYKQNDITISSVNGNKFVALTIVAYDNSGYTAWKTILETAGYTVYEEGMELTVLLDSVTEVKLVNTTTSTIKIAGVKVHYIPHVHSYTETVTAPTCTEAGYTTYTCACGNTYTGNEVASLGHDMIVDEAVAPTCTATGLTEGSHCSRCDHKVAQEVVDALGHDMIVDEAVAPTCTSTGLTEGSHCSRCDHKVAQEEVPVADHIEEVVAGKDATCTETGLTEGKVCSACGEVLVAQEETPVIDHTYVEGKCECGAEEPVVEPPVTEPEVEEEPELNFFEKIIAWFMELIQKFLGFFKKD